MKISTLFVSCLLVTQLSNGQNAVSLYRTGDSLYKVKDYRNSALAYSAAIKQEGNAAAMNRYLGLASRWALAGDTDSSFYYLDIIRKSDRLNRVQAKTIENDLDLNALRNDKRWKPVLAAIQQQAENNGYSQEELVYGRKDGMGLTMIRIKPRVNPNGKAIISVQSGSWFSSYNGIELNTIPLEQYLKKGYTVFGVIHGSQPRYAIPDALNDIRRAVRYIRFNAGRFGIDPDRIGITGTSAGGHLSLLIATTEDSKNPAAADPVDRVSSRVQAVAVLFPPTDFLNWGGSGFNFVNARQILVANRTWGAVDFKVFNEKTILFEEVTDTAARNKIGAEVSPINSVSPDDPPVFIVHGDADPVVPLQQSQFIMARFNEAKVPNRFVIKKGGKHNNEDMKPEWLEFVDWFDKYLK